MKTEELKQRLKSLGLSPDVCDLIADQTDTGKAALILNDPLSGKNFGIADDDLPVLETAAKSIVAFVGATVGMGWAPAVIAHLVTLAYQFRKKRFELTGFQVAVLSELKANPNTAVDELAELLGRNAKEVTEELQRLSELRRTDGKKVAVVSKDSQCRWSVEGI